MIGQILILYFISNYLKFNTSKKFDGLVNLFILVNLIFEVGRFVSIVLILRNEISIRDIELIESRIQDYEYFKYIQGLKIICIAISGLMFYFELLDENSDRKLVLKSSFVLTFSYLLLYSL